jgi:hypothetical protein
MRRKAITVAVLGTLVMLAVASVSVGQPQGRGAQRGGQRGGMFDPARMREMMEQRMREQLGATDEEWKVLGPRLTKVMNLSRQTSGGMGRMMMGRRGRQGGQQGGPGGPGEPGGAGGAQGGRRGGRGMPGGEPTAVDTAAEALQTTLGNTEATPEDIKAKLTALRSAKEKAMQELAKAQQDLRQVLTLRQEAQLVLMGMLN